jgi:TRAP-type mannitol/chloroaromatic compound transport system permease small subunit
VINETWFFAHASLQMGERLRGIFRVDAFPFHVLMPIGLSLLSLEVIRTIVLDLTALARGKPELAQPSHSPGSIVDHRD